MQGTAAAYDLGRFGDAGEVRLADMDEGRAVRAAARVNALLNRPVVRPFGFNAKSDASVHGLLARMDACLSAVPYFLNLALTERAIAAGVCFNDLGGNTDVVRGQLALDAKAKAASVSVIPDCGLPNTLAAQGIRSLDRAQHVRIYSGALPQNRSLPLGYKVTFALDGLTNQYFGKALVLRNGKVQEVDTFTELESITFPAPVGVLEAFTTSGGTSTCPYTYEGQIETYEYKTLRYPGHYDALKLLRDLGFLDQTAIDVDGVKVTPRAVFHKVMEKTWTFPDEPDLLILRVVVDGEKNGKPAGYIAELVDRPDPATGFSAMERMTAFTAAIVTAMQARKEIGPGAQPLELAVDPGTVIAGLERRGLPLKITRPA